jgi:hypothetical protein
VVHYIPPSHPVIILSKIKNNHPVMWSCLQWDFQSLITTHIEIFTPEGFFLSQEKYILDHLDRASFTDHRTAETLMKLNVHLTTTDCVPLEDPTRYHHIIGSLIYLCVTRLDISYSVHILSQFVSATTQIYYSHLLRVMRYLCGTSTRRLFFSCTSSLQL